MGINYLGSNGLGWVCLTLSCPGVFFFFESYLAMYLYRFVHYVFFSTSTPGNCFFLSFENILLRGREFEVLLFGGIYLGRFWL